MGVLAAKGKKLCRTNFPNEKTNKIHGGLIIYANIATSNEEKTMLYHSHKNMEWFGSRAIFYCFKA